MFMNKFDSYYYSRPIAYRSYYPRVTRPEVLRENDADTQEVLGFLNSQNVFFQNLGGLSRGIRIGDLEMGKRQYNHNNYNVPTEYYIHQWKPTNDRAKVHPVGTHFVSHSFPDFMEKLFKIIEARKLKS